MLFFGWEVCIVGNCGKWGFENVVCEVVFRWEVVFLSLCYCKNFRLELNELLLIL